MSKLECVQGASFGYDVTCDEVPVFDTNWVGSWAIVAGLDDITDGDDLVTLASGPLVHSADDKVLEVRILPTETNIIPVDEYVLVVQVVNAVLDFSEEVVQEPFLILEQGIA